MRNLDRKRLTLLNLRGGRIVQHVVMAKSYQKSHDGSVSITVYDSNQPSKDQIVFFDNQQGQFYAPLIFNLFYGWGGGTKALGTYIVDEKERLKFEEAMVAYYKYMCQ